jgi:radical SAM superfamily enzyme YgiQ (UPF0313 family)
MLKIVQEKPRPPADRVRAILDARFPRGRIARVLLINPPDGDAKLFRAETARRRRYHNYPPYGLGVLGAHLRKAGVEPRVLNLNHEVLVAACEADSAEGFDFDHEWQSRLDRAIADFQPDLIGVTCMFTMTHPAFKQVVARAAASGVPVSIGGVHVSNDVERVLDDVPEAGLAFLWEGDLSLPTFCRVVAGEAPVDALAQVIVRDGDERHRYLDEQRPTADEMDVTPAFDLFDVEPLARYGVVGIFHAFLPAGTPASTSLSNRGCRARCTFCSVPNFNGRVVRQRPVEHVLDELEAQRDLGVKHIVWLDDDLLKDHARAMRLFGGMAERRLGLTWDATNGLIAASINDELVAAMEASGCIAVNIGMESGNPTTLKEIRKPGTVDTFLQAADVLRRFPGIHARVLLMIGFPGETLRRIEDTLSVALQMDLDWYAVTPLQPLPNTPIYDAMVEQGLIAPVGGLLTFMSGGYGKQDKLDESNGASMAGFRDAFTAIAPNAVPTPDQIHDIWFYMNYHLNYHRLFHENRPLKIAQMLQHFATLSEKLSPDHPLALYFTGYLQQKSKGAIEPSVVTRLRGHLERSSYWRTRFEAFGMSADDLANGRFPNEQVPRITFGEAERTALAPYAASPARSSGR